MVYTFKNAIMFVCSVILFFKVAKSTVIAINYPIMYVHDYDALQRYVSDFILTSDHDCEVSERIH